MLERGLSQLQTLRKRHPSQFSSRRTVSAHLATHGCGIVTNTIAEVGTGPAAIVAPSVGNPGKALLEDVVEVDTESSKGEGVEEEVAAEVVAAPTTPPIRTALEIDMSASTATLGMRGVVAAGMAGDSHR